MLDVRCHRSRWQRTIYLGHQETNACRRGAIGFPTVAISALRQIHEILVAWLVLLPRPTALTSRGQPGLPPSLLTEAPVRRPTTARSPVTVRPPRRLRFWRVATRT